MSEGGMIAVFLSKLQFMVLVIVLSEYSKNVRKAVAQNEMLIMKMI